jgi:hypothetical protein
MPSHAQADASPDADPIVVDAGNGITATVDPASGGVHMTTPTPLIWDPNLTTFTREQILVEGYNRFGYGVGWTFSSPGWPDGIRFMNTAGGVEFYFPDLGRLFAADASTETGLVSSYPRNDVRVLRADPPQRLADRDDIPARNVFWTLHQLETNVMEYYGEFGDLLATVNLETNARWDWVYETYDGYEGDEHQLRRVVDADGKEVFHVEELEDGEWFRFHQNGRTADVWTAGYYAEVVRIVTPQARTTFDYARSADGKLPWLTSISTLATDGSSAIDVRITWDLSRPGNATRVERCAAGACTDVYPVP